jgi:hypothetical protein
MKRTRSHRRYRRRRPCFFCLALRVEIPQWRFDVEGQGDVDGEPLKGDKGDDAMDFELPDKVDILYDHWKEVGITQKYIRHRCPKGGFRRRLNETHRTMHVRNAAIHLERWCLDIEDKAEAYRLVSRFLTGYEGVHEAFDNVEDDKIMMMNLNNTLGISAYVFQSRVDERFSSKFLELYSYTMPIFPNEQANSTSSA